MTLANEFWTQPLFPFSFNEDFDYFGSTLATGDFNGDGFGDLSIGAPNEDIGVTGDTGRIHTVHGSFFGLDFLTTDVWDDDVLGPVSVAEVGDMFGSSQIAADFNGDGFDDLAIGAWREDVGFTLDAGAVTVGYGSFFGITDVGSQYWTEDDIGGGNIAFDSDYFGSTLAAGDFDGDGYDDLAIGAFGDDLGFVQDAGEVNVLHGSFFGLTNFGSTTWGAAIPQDFSYFGTALSTGDFNGDGYDDLVSGSPHLDFIGAVDGGALEISYGSFFGLDTVNTDFFSQDTFGVAGITEAGDEFASSLASGDFNGDGYDDLAVGVAGEDRGSVIDSGSVNLMYGSIFGITTFGNHTLTQDNLIGGSVGSEAMDGFGTALAVGDFNLDGYDDLVVGAPGETLNAQEMGAVDVIYGSALGLTGTSHQFFHQDIPGILDVGEAFDHFGSSLAVHDFNGDGIDDLAIGASGEDIGGIVDVGAVHVLHGSLNGLVV